MILANYSAGGGIKHYFDTLKTLPTKEKIEFSNFGSIKLLVKSSKHRRVVFTHLTKEFILFLILGGRGAVMCHDPKLRVGFGWRDFLLLKMLIFFKKNVECIIVHSEPALWLARHFEVIRIEMPIGTIERDDRTHLLFFGRVMKYKGLHKYIRIFDEIESVKITVAGYIDRRLKKHIQKSSSCEILEGYISDDLLDCLIARCDYVFMPYDDVTNTNVHTLAFERARPVIRTNIPGFKSWINVNKDLVFPKDDNEELEKILSSLPRRDTKKYNLYCEKAIEYFDDKKLEAQAFWPTMISKLDQNPK
jgi:glycosyltransferase involved in cell wall biosynthesis